MKGLFKILFVAVSAAFLLNSRVPDGLLDERNSANRKKLLYLMIGFLSLALLILIYVGKEFTRPTIFHVEANTDVVTILVEGGSNSGFFRRESESSNISASSWYISSAYVELEGEEDVFSEGSLSVEFPSDAIIEIQQVNGEQAFILVEANGKNEGDLLRVSIGDIVYKSVTSLYIEIDIGELGKLVLPIDGNIKVGSGVKEGVTHVPLLRSGTVDLIDKSIVGGHFYSVGPFALKLGDTFLIEGIETQSSGFVSFSRGEIMQVAFSGKGRDGFIERYKSERVSVKNSLISRLYHDPAVIALWVIVLVVYWAVAYGIRRIMKEPCNGE